jgi:hypothetical protein
VDELSATILRCARERWNAMEDLSEGEESDTTTEGSEEADREVTRGLGASPSYGIESGAMDIDDYVSEEASGYNDSMSHPSDGEGPSTAASEQSQKKWRKRKRKHSPEIEHRPVFSADDEKSFKLVRPVVNSIVGQLERTLTALSNSHMAALALRRSPSVTTTDEEGEEEEASGKDEDEENRGRSKREKLKGKRNYFRNKAYATSGSDHEDSSNDSERISSSRSKPQSQRKPKILRQTSRGRERSRSRGRPRSRTPAPGKLSGSQSKSASARRKSRFRHNVHGQGTWKTVLAAASMSGGFSDEVLRRTAQRCADLFGESLEFASISDQRLGITKHKIVPGGDSTRMLEEIRVQEEESEWAGRRSRSRSIAASRSRSRSRVSITRRWFCPHPECPRSEEPFTRMGNVERHIEMVHDGKGMDLIEETVVDSGIEKEGGLHVDSFLRPIKVRKGWRGKGVEKKA